MLKLNALTLWVCPSLSLQILDLAECHGCSRLLKESNNSFTALAPQCKSKFLALLANTQRENGNNTNCIEEISTSYTVVVSHCKDGFLAWLEDIDETKQTTVESSARYKVAVPYSEGRLVIQLWRPTLSLAGKHRDRKGSILQWKGALVIKL